MLGVMGGRWNIRFVGDLVVLVVRRLDGNFEDFLRDGVIYTCITQRTKNLFAKYGFVLMGEQRPLCRELNKSLG